MLPTNYVEGKDTAAGISDRNDTNKVRHTWSGLKVCQQVKRKESAELLDDVIEGWTKLLGPTKVPDYSFKNIPNTKLTVQMEHLLNLFDQFNVSKGEENKKNLEHSSINCLSHPKWTNQIFFFKT